MPITINDCVECGSNPVIIPSRNGYDSCVFVMCPQEHERNWTGLHQYGNSAIEEWNDLNATCKDSLQVEPVGDSD